MNQGNYTTFNMDVPGAGYDDGKGAGNLYGTHPFLMMKTETGLFTGIYFANSNAQQLQIVFKN
ncbi:MAG: hypothetical protein IPK55_11845 [Streptococcus sp.]|nr:hypothetical protein [Streptococcus sp.]